MNVSTIGIVARNEVRRVLNNPFTVVIVVVLLVMILLNSVTSGYKLGLYESQLEGLGDVFVSVGLSTITFNMAMLFTILSLFIGLNSISEERSGGALNTLIAKPVYKKEMIAGKFIGLCGFVWVLVIVSLLLSLLLITACFRAPISFEDTLYRMCAYTVLQFANCALSIGLMIFFGVLLRNYYHALLCCASYFFFTWFLIIPYQFNFISFFLPSSLYFRIMDPVTGLTYLLNTTVPFDTWLSGALPYLVLLCLEALVVLSMSLAVFSLKDD